MEASQGPEVLRYKGVNEIWTPEEKIDFILKVSASRSHRSVAIEAMGINNVMLFNSRYIEIQRKLVVVEVDGVYYKRILYNSIPLDICSSKGIMQLNYSFTILFSNNSLYSSNVN